MHSDKLMEQSREHMLYQLTFCSILLTMFVLNVTRQHHKTHNTSLHQAQWSENNKSWLFILFNLVVATLSLKITAKSSLKTKHFFLHNLALT